MSETTYDALVVGAGFSGMAMAIELQNRGINNFLILEEASEVGGTWRDNAYPGAECDVASALYSYSFEHNAAWKYKWSGQQEILDYQRGVASKYGIYDKIEFNRHVCSAHYDETNACWAITTDCGRHYKARFFVSAVGQLHRPSIPEFAGAENFKGPRFHSAQWRQDVDLAEKRIAVIGNAASALQFIPKIASKAAQLTIFQRSPNWVVAKQDRPYSNFEQKISARFPWVTKIYRLRLWLRNECLMYPALKQNRLASWILRHMALKEMRKHIADPELRKVLTPDYPVGAKRILISDDYYAAIARDNVSLQLSPIAEITESGIRCKNGKQQDFDVIIYGTGFQTNPFLADIEVTGAGGRKLSEHWKDGAQAYLGVATAGFPNMFMLYGPNTNLGHNSIIIMIEAQSRYIVRCIEQTMKQGSKQLQVRAAAEQSYNARIQDRLKKMVFSEVDASWYKQGDRITNNWPYSTWTYRRKLADVRWDDYELQ